MAAKEKQKTEAEMEPGFFSDYGYGNGTALRFIDEPAEDKSKKRHTSKEA